jgi:Fe2+ or Zn2+ uptake regulation protein
MNSRAGTALDYERTAIKALRERGFRITNPRVEVIRVLAAADRPLTASQIHEEIVATGGRIDAVSVYRILSTLQEARLASRLSSAEGYVARFNPDGFEVTLVVDADGTKDGLELPDGIFEMMKDEVRRAGYNLEDLVIEARVNNPRS